MNGPIGEMLDAYRQTASLRLHMPGHGGALNEDDVTELCVTDDLLDPRRGGAIRTSEQMAANLYGVQKTLYSCSGATLCIQAGLAFLLSRLPKGAIVVCERRVHRSVLHALALLDLTPVFVEDLFDLPEKTALLIFCGCDYYGAIPDYPALSALCKRRRISTLIDNAHGAHLRFWEKGALHPARYGFDLIVDSVHKTMNCLTGGALLHLSRGFTGDREEAYEELKHFFRVFSTSSPSFPILRSLEEAVLLAGTMGEQILQKEKAILDTLRQRIGALSSPPAGDPFRLVLRGDYAFDQLYDALIERGVMCEFYERDALVMIPRFGLTQAQAQSLEQTLLELLPRVTRAPETKKSNPAPEIKQRLSLRKALLSPGRFVEAERAVGCLAGEIVGRYPPGNGLVLPGEELTEQAIALSGKRRIRVVEEDS